MHTASIVLLIVAFVLAVPSFIRILCGDFRKMLWSDIFFDVVVISVAILTKNLVAVVGTEILCNMFVGWMYQKRTDEIYASMKK